MPGIKGSNIVRPLFLRITTPRRGEAHAMERARWRAGSWARAENWVHRNHTSK
ncbi:hypothetical protein CVT26_004048 [Gymnopilus dilepis]|uniref:Uncharacterized protein n=1 Tax=Gymnopilus dilepis TaxID=231916 RepID=A0A409YMR1_9AGAR|nr:hypothetical protein CVT26_004048 [Gymnopilus dilepis]